MKRKPTPYPYPFYFWQITGYALLGLLISLYLGYTHYKNHTDIAFSSFCAITQAINCDTVAQSPWSTLWGIPIAFWGVFSYALFLLLLAPLKRFSDQRIPDWSLVTLLALLAVCCSVALAVISHFRIHSWCILCVVTYGVNFLLAFSSWIAFRRFSPINFFPALISACRHMMLVKTVKFGVPALAILVLSIGVALPPYWHQQPETMNSQVTTGLTPEGFPWIGAEKPHITIEEFTDYQCFQCKKMHMYLRQLINRHPDRIRLVHRHYPLDNEFNRIIAPNPFHVGSGRMALVAIVAAEHNAFWPVNDALYATALSKKKFIKIEEFAQLMGLNKEQLATEMFTAKTLKHLQHDIVQGLKHGITGTPSFVINGKMHEKTLPPELLRDIVR